MLIGVMPVVSSSASVISSASAMTTGVYCWDYISQNEYALYSFIPSVSDYYRFFTVGSLDTYVEAYDINDKYLDNDDDSGVVNNCNLTLYLQKGKTYNFYVAIYDLRGEYYACIDRMSTVKYTGIAKNTTYDVNLDKDTTSKFFKYVPRQSGYYAFSSKGSEDAYCIFYDKNFNPLYSDDDGAVGGEHDFYLDCYLEAGQTYYFEATKYEPWVLDSYTVSIKETAVVKDIEIVHMPNDMTCYRRHEAETIYLDGLKVKLTYSDGTVKYWTYNEDYIDGSNLQYTWGYDENDELVIKLYTTFDEELIYLDAQDNPVKSLKLIDPPEIKFYENTGGYYNEDWGYYIYYMPRLDDLQIEVTYKDGSKEIVSYKDGINGKDFYYYTDQDMYAWTLGAGHLLTIEYYGVHAYIDVEIVENPVQSVVLNNAPTAKYMYGDNTCGFIEQDGSYVFVPIKFEGISLTVNYKDGTHKDFDYKDFDIENWTLDGQPLGSDLIHTNGVGEYEAVLYLMGFEVRYNVSVVDKIKGDVDLDGVVSIMDATAIQLYKANKITLSDDAVAVADVDDDKTVSVMDATEIQLFIANKIDSL